MKSNNLLLIYSLSHTCGGCAGFIKLCDDVKLMCPCVARRKKKLGATIHINDDDDDDVAVVVAMRKFIHFIASN
jgi:hypothetical protein